MNYSDFLEKDDAEDVYIIDDTDTDIGDTAVGPDYSKLMNRAEQIHNKVKELKQMIETI